MSSHQRAQRLLAQTMQHELAKKQQPRLRIVVSEAVAQSASFESLIAQPLFVNSTVLKSSHQGVEGMQQMQHHAKQKAMQDMEPDEPPTSVPTVYVTSPVSILRGDDDALRAVSDAVRQSLDRNERVALSLLPVKLNDASGDEQFFLDSVLDSIERSIGRSEVAVCTSMEALERFANA